MESVNICNEKAWYSPCHESRGWQYDVIHDMGEGVVVVKTNLRGERVAMIS
jgi:hypothetical protein